MKVLIERIAESMERQEIRMGFFLRWILIKIGLPYQEHDHAEGREIPQSEAERRLLEEMDKRILDIMEGRIMHHGKQASQGRRPEDHDGDITTEKSY